MSRHSGAPPLAAGAPEDRLALWAAKDVEAKRSPYLVPWEELPDRAREWNRSAVRSIPSLLASVNLAVMK